MADSPMSRIADYYRSRHELILKVVTGLDEGQFLWRPNRTAPSIAFHVWHVARWADYLQAMLAGDGIEIWVQEGLAARWGFRSEDLGFAETGLGMDDDASAALPFPGKEAVLDYARRVFAQAGQVIGGIRDDEFQRPVRDRRAVEGEEMAAGDAVLNWLVHDSRHLGMIECLLGLQGLHGTATR